ncbi:MAG: Bax inhibitor-1 family protein [Deltaproteobacteria bacterium]|nr:Bax inhibitor-1 family protein [Kofleriaceae bacterium]
MQSTAFPSAMRRVSATVGVSDRIAFLRKTYLLLGAALVALAAFTGGMMTLAPETSLAMSRWAFGGSWHWLLVLGAFMAVGYAAERLAWSPSSRGLQYLGLAIGVVAQGLLLQPLLWAVIVTLGVASAGTVIAQATLITLTIFVGLTLTVFVTKKDFSFLRGALVVASFAALGVIVASLLFGFQLGALFAGVMVLVMAGYILYQTSLVLSQFPPTAHVASALMLFSTVATLFWYVLQLLLAMRRE